MSVLAFLGIAALVVAVVVACTHGAWIRRYIGQRIALTEQHLADVIVGRIAAKLTDHNQALARGQIAYADAFAQQVAPAVTEAIKAALAEAQKPARKPAARRTTAKAKPEDIAALADPAPAPVVELNAPRKKAATTTRRRTTTPKA